MELLPTFILLMIVLWHVISLREDVKDIKRHLGIKDGEEDEE